jgi:two-component system, OmpR family, sensor histidine kinase BaeS
VSGRPPRRRLARRLLLGQVLVIVVGALTLTGVALLVGPPVFRHHVHEALGQVTDEVALHLDEAFSTTLWLAFSIGVSAAVVAALVISWLLASRIARPVEDLSHAAERIAEGHLDARAPLPPANDELADLTGAFNEMATSLEHTEDRRARLLSDVAHELRTPLSTVEGYLEGLEDGVVEPDAAAWGTLRDASQRLRRLVDDLALVSRAEEGRLELDLVAVDVADLVERAVRAGDLHAREAGVRMRVEGTGEALRVRGDEARLRQVLANLLDNAIRHTPAGGDVTVTSGPARGGVAVEVVDTGSGIAPDDLPHVFERFYRADPARAAGAGSGIGLTISRAIAHAHGGELTAAHADHGRGARFTLWLPGA